MNKEVRQGYGLLPDLFKIYMNKAIKEHETLEMASS
jgi:hypothetical protein